MLKGKGVFAVIAMILVIGLGITSYTSHYINKQTAFDTENTGTGASETTAAAQSMVQAQAEAEKDITQQPVSSDQPAAAAANGYEGANNAAAPETNIPEAGAEPRAAKEDAGKTAADMKENTEQDAQTSSSMEETQMDNAAAVLISPISGVPETVIAEQRETMVNLMEQKAAYIKRLDELSAQIDKLWKADTEATSSSMKQTADYELKMWDNELNKIYQDVRKTLNEADAEVLKEAELQWIKDRDTRALSASKQVGNSSLESLEYTRSLAESTKLRTYELVDIYFEEE